MISPWVKMIVETQEWKNADVVHYQLLRGFPISAYEMNRLSREKKRYGRYIIVGHLPVVVYILYNVRSGRTEDVMIVQDKMRKAW